MASSNVVSKAQVPQSEVAPRRVVLLKDDEQSGVAKVLQEWSGPDANAADVHEAVRRHGAEHPDRLVAAEWQSWQGWERFLWRRPDNGRA